MVHYKNIVALLAGFVVSGCGADGVWGTAYESLKMAVKGAPKLEISGGGRKGQRQVSMARNPGATRGLQ